MQRMRAVLGGLLLFIWIMAAAGCTDQKPEQTVNSEESQYCWGKAEAVRLLWNRHALCWSGPENCWL